MTTTADHERPQPTSADQIRTGQRDLWNRFASGWERWDDLVQSMLGPVGSAMVQTLDIAEDQRHLDLAAGTGEPGLTIATFAPLGHVTLADISSEMLQCAQRGAASRSIRNVLIRECSADDLPFPDDAFDSVTCRFGLMFFPELAVTVGEMARVVRPGGQVCAAVWAEPAANPWVTIPAAAIAAEVDLAPPDPHAPGMFRCAARGSVVSRFEQAGLGAIEEWDVSIQLALESPEQYWTLLTELTAPVVDALSQIDEPAQHRIAGRVVEAAREFEVDGALRLPGKARCVIGTKAEPKDDTA